MQIMIANKSAKNDYDIAEQTRKTEQVPKAILNVKVTICDFLPQVMDVIVP